MKKIPMSKNFFDF